MKGQGDGTCLFDVWGDSKSEPVGVDLLRNPIYRNAGRCYTFNEKWTREDERDVQTLGQVI